MFSQISLVLIHLSSKTACNNFFDAKKPHFFNYQHRNLSNYNISMLFF